MALSQNQLDKIRKDISNVVKNAVSNKENLLIKHPPGIGKTATTLKTALEMKDYNFIYLSPNHKHSESLENKDFLIDIGYPELLHIKGLFQEDESGTPLCSNPKVKDLFACNFSKDKICKPFEEDKDRNTCGNHENCPYLNQFRNLDDNESWRGVNEHLSTSFLKGFERDFIIIDENPVSSLVTTLEITDTDLIDNKGFISSLYESLSLKDKKKYKSVTKQIFHIIDVFVKILQDTNLKTKQTKKDEQFDGLLNMDFVRRFISFTGWQDSKLSQISDFFYSDLVADFIQLYEKRLFDEIMSSNDFRVKNILDDIYEIASKCISHYVEYKGKDVCIPIYAETEMIRKEGKTSYRNKIVIRKITRNIPDVPLIILDATGQKEYCEKIFDREFTVCDIPEDIEIEKNIIQTIDGRLFSSSLFYDETRKRWFDAVRLLVKHHRQNHDGDIAIISMKRYGKIEDENDMYVGKSIERYLNEHGIKKGIRYYHYGATKGLNDLEDVKVIILLGTYEPNHYAFKKEVMVWHEGEVPIDTRRRKDIDKSLERTDEGYEYIDKRYALHVKQKREAELEHCLERIRNATTEGNVAYLLTSQPISYPTMDYSLRNLLLTVVGGIESTTEFDAAFPILKKIAISKGIASYSKINQTVRNHIVIKEWGGTQKVIDFMLSKGFIEPSGKNSFKMTDLGKRWYKTAKLIEKWNK